MVYRNKKLIQTNNIGDVRHVTKFAYLPHKIEDGVWAWLTEYISIEQYSKLYKRSRFDYWRRKIKCYKWVEKARMLPKQD